MEIAAPDIDTPSIWVRLGEIAIFLAHTSCDDSRPCMSCGLRCKKCGQTDCTCNCSPDCPEASALLSSDPEVFPIEPNIVPLVFALARLKVCPPCWSCEGHLDRDGNIHRRPGVWFYANSIVYPQLIGEAIQALTISGRLQAPWQVALVSLGRGTNTSFSIEPILEGKNYLTLSHLWEDVKVISKALSPDLIRVQALRFVEDISSALKESQSPPAIRARAGMRGKGINLPSL